MTKKDQDVLRREDIDTVVRAMAAPNVERGIVNGRMTFEAFTNLRRAVGHPIDRYLRPQTFMQLRRDAEGRISAELLVAYLSRLQVLESYSHQLYLRDSRGKGSLQEEELEVYIKALLESDPSLQSDTPEFTNFHTHHVVRHFFFFAACPDLISITDLVVSEGFQEFVAWVERKLPNPHATWFSFQSAGQVYKVFLQLDSDGDGMLTASELAQYNGGALTKTFVERIFQEHPTYVDGMDFRNFLDFELAMRYMSKPAGIRYCWKALDVRKEGRLTAWTIRAFFREITALMIKAGEVPIAVEDVQTEIFDMVRPKDPTAITLQELIDCGVGETVIRMLVDMKGFMSYEDRENVLHDDDDDEHDAGNRP